MLHTERLILRRWGEEDLAPFAAINADPEVMSWLVAPLSREVSDRLVERIESHFELHGFGLWAVCRRSDDGLLGMVGAQYVPFEAAFAPAIEIGWRLRRDAWGAGYCTEAASAAIDDVFARLPVDQLVSFTAPRNHRSCGVMRRLGMSRDVQGDFEHPRLPKAHPLRSHWLFRLTRSDWAGHAPKMPPLPRTPA